MRFEKTQRGDERGLAIVEATILLPVCFLMVLAVYYASLFMCQKANMQANLQTALLYYKNPASDSFVIASDRNANALTSAGEGTYVTDASAFRVDRALNPYRFLGITFNLSEGIGDFFDENGFERFFHRIAGRMFFDTGENIEVTVTNVTNYVIYKSVRVRAEQTLQPAISFALIGLPDEITIHTEAEVVISDGEDFIRNVDFAADLIADTKLGDMLGNVANKIKNVYSNIRDKLLG